MRIKEQKKWYIVFCQKEVKEAVRNVQTTAQEIDWLGKETVDEEVSKKNAETKKVF